MSIKGGPDITTEGLVLHLDAANRDSYPGTGTTWYDLSNNENHVSFQGNLSSSSLNNKSFVMSGSDWFQNDSFVVSPQNNELSISIWCLTSDNGINDMLIDLCNTSDTTISRDRFSIRQNWTGGVAAGRTSCYFKNSSNVFAYTYLQSQVPTDEWQNISYTKVASNIYVYLNGQQVNSGTVSGDIASINRCLIGGDNLFTSYDRLYGRISMVTVYDHGLSSDEVLQNYNATRARYGL